MKLDDSRDLGLPDAPDAPPVLTVEDLIAQGLARRISTSKSGHHVQISPAGHDALGENQRLRAEANQRWRHRGDQRP